MRIVTVAFGSFTLGAVLMFLLGNHTSTVPQLVFAAQDQLFTNPTLIPAVPPLKGKALLGGGWIADMAYQLDGVESKDIKFKNVTFVYGGGAYKLENATIVGPVGIKLVGAAANTANFLAMFGLLGCPTSKPQNPDNNPNQPVMKTASLNAPLTGDLESPFGQFNRR